MYTVVVANLQYVLIICLTMDVGNKDSSLTLRSSIYPVTYKLGSIRVAGITGLMHSSSNGDESGGFKATKNSITHRAVH